MSAFQLVTRHWWQSLQETSTTLVKKPPKLVIQVQ